MILTRPVQWTANVFTVRFATKVNRAHEQVQFGSIWRTCICENNKIVIVIIMCSKLMFFQRFKYTDHYYTANIWCSCKCTFCQQWFLKIKSESESEAEKPPSHRYGAKLMPCALLCIGPSNGCRCALFYTTLLPRCFADAAVIRNYRDNHTYSQNLLCQHTPYWTKVNRTWFWPRMRPKWTELNQTEPNRKRVWPVKITP